METPDPQIATIFATELVTLLRKHGFAKGGGSVEIDGHRVVVTLGQHRVMMDISASMVDLPLRRRAPMRWKAHGHLKVLTTA